MSEDLVAFLREQLDAEEREAQAATPGPWRHSPEKHWRKPGTSWFEEAVFAGASGEDAVCVAGTGTTDDPQSMADAAHIARHDPARVLAEIAAKRVMIETFTKRYHSAWDVLAAPIHGRALQTVLSYLALPYADHPDYLPEWAPAE